MRFTHPIDDVIAEIAQRASKAGLSRNAEQAGMEIAALEAEHPWLRGIAKITMDTGEQRDFALRNTVPQMVGIIADAASLDDVRGGNNYVNALQPRASLPPWLTGAAWVAGALAAVLILKPVLGVLAIAAVAIGKMAWNGASGGRLGIACNAIRDGVRKQMAQDDGSFQALRITNHALAKNYWLLQQQYQGNAPLYQGRDGTYIHGLQDKNSPIPLMRCQGQLAVADKLGVATVSLPQDIASCSTMAMLEGLERAIKERAEALANSDLQLSRAAIAELTADNPANPSAIALPGQPTHGGNSLPKPKP